MTEGLEGRLGEIEAGYRALQAENDRLRGEEAQRTMDCNDLMVKVETQRMEIASLRGALERIRGPEPKESWGGLIYYGCCEAGEEYGDPVCAKIAHKALSGPGGEEE